MALPAGVVLALAPGPQESAAGTGKRAEPFPQLQLQKAVLQHDDGS